jgi:hypothetical protein
MFAWMLTACQSSTPQSVEQQNLLTPCADLPDITGTTGDHVLSTMITWGNMYIECQTRHNALIKVSK